MNTAENDSYFPTLMGLPWRALRGLGRGIRWLWRKTWRYSLGLLILLIIAHIIFNFIAGRKLEAELQKIRAAGAPLTIMEAAPPPVPDNENAAALYLWAFRGESGPVEAHRILSEPWPKVLLGKRMFPSSVSKMIDDFRGASNNKTPRPTLAQMKPIIKKYDGIYHLLDKASRMKECRFPVNWQSGFAAMFPHLTGIREATRFLIAKALVEAAYGNSSAALEDFAIAIRMTDQVSSEPTMVPQLVRANCYKMVFKRLPDIFVTAPPTVAESRAFYELLAKTNLTESLVHSLESARAEGILMFKFAHKDGILWSINAESGNEPPLWAKKLVPWRAIFNPIWEPFLKLDEIYYLQNMHVLIEQLSKSLTPGINGNEKPEDVLRKAPWYAVISRGMFSGYSGQFSKMTELSAMFGLTQAATALRVYQIEHNVYPPSLDELHKSIGWEIPNDPFNNKPFIYRREGKGYIIYSVGPDMKDNGGIDQRTARRKNLGKPSFEVEYDFPLRMPR